MRGSLSQRLRDARSHCTGHSIRLVSVRGCNGNGNVIARRLKPRRHRKASAAVLPVACECRLSIGFENRLHLLLWCCNCLLSPLLLLSSSAAASSLLSTLKLPVAGCNLHQSIPNDCRTTRTQFECTMGALVLCIIGGFDFSPSVCQIRKLVPVGELESSPAPRDCV